MDLLQILMTKNCALVTVRNSSTRLPNKAILEVVPNMKTIEAVIARAKLTGFPVVIATSTDSSDDIFETIAAENGVGIYRGALLNKIKRWKDCFDTLQIDNALLVDGDDLMYDFNIGKRAIAALEQSNAVMIKHPENVICGYFTYAISKKGIDSIYQFAQQENTNTDVITEFVKKSGIEIEMMSLESWEMNQPFRLTLDYEDDLLFFTKLIEGIGIEADGKLVTEYLLQHPEIVNINLYRQDDWAKNQAKFNEGVKQSIS